MTFQTITSVSAVLHNARRIRDRVLSSADAAGQTNGLESHPLKAAAATPNGAKEAATAGKPSVADLLRQRCAWQAMLRQSQSSLTMSSKGCLRPSAGDRLRANARCHGMPCGLACSMMFLCMKGSTFVGSTFVDCVWTAFVLTVAMHAAARGVGKGLADESFHITRCGLRASRANSQAARATH